MFEALTSHTGIFDCAAIDATHVKAYRSAAGRKGAFLQAIGRSRGGRTIKLHGLVDDRGRAPMLLLSAGHINSISVAEALIRSADPLRRLPANKGYDADRFSSYSMSAAIPPIAFRRAHPFPRTSEPTGAQQGRAHVVQAQGLPACCSPIRQARQGPARRCLHRSSLGLLPQLIRSLGRAGSGPRGRARDGCG